MLLPFSVVRLLPIEQRENTRLLRAFYIAPQSSRVQPFSCDTGRRWVADRSQARPLVRNRDDPLIVCCAALRRANAVTSECYRKHPLK